MKTPNPDTRAMKCHRYLCTLLAAPTRRCSASSAVSPAALHSPFATACFAATYSPASRCAVAMRQKILATAAAAIGAPSAAAASANPAASRAQPNAAEYAFLRSATAARLLCAAAAFRRARAARSAKPDAPAARSAGMASRRESSSTDSPYFLAAIQQAPPNHILQCVSTQDAR